MKKVNPEISQKFLEEIKHLTNTIVEVEGIKIKTSQNVFPPQSNFSSSSKKLYKTFGELKDLDVLDMGTGTGIHAIRAALAGAKHVVAVDINPEAVICAKENTRLNGAEDKVEVLHSDLFSSIKPTQKFDIVIANLPISDFPIEGIVESALYDPEYRIRRRFFTEVKKYLKNSGVIIMTHANFKGAGDFEEFERIVSEYGLSIESFVETVDLGYSWRMYRIKSI